jgi:hypothetical protein
MKPLVRRTVFAGVAFAACCLLAQATSIDRSVPEELDSLARIVTDAARLAYPDEQAFFEALGQPVPRRSQQSLPALLAQLDASPYERRFYFVRGVDRRDRAIKRLAVTSSGGWGRKEAFCADTKPSLCVRRDGFAPRVRAGRCEDPRCEAFDEGRQHLQAAATSRGGR